MQKSSWLLWILEVSLRKLKVHPINNVYHFHTKQDKYSLSSILTGNPSMLSPSKNFLTTQRLITLDGEEASLMERLAKALSTSTLEMEEFLELNQAAQEMPQLENQDTINLGSSLAALRLIFIMPFLVFPSLTPQSIKLSCFGPSSTREYYTVVIDSFFLGRQE